jgi:hypothetical protein
MNKNETGDDCNMYLSYEAYTMGSINGDTIMTCIRFALDYKKLFQPTVAAASSASTSPKLTIAALSYES